MAELLTALDEHRRCGQPMFDAECPTPGPTLLT